MKRTTSIAVFFLACIQLARAQYTLEPLMANGMQAPGMPDGVTIIGTFPGSTSISRINEFGHMYLMGALAGPGIDNTNDVALWVATANDVTLVWQEGRSVGGLPGEIRFDGDPIVFGIGSDDSIVGVFHLAGTGVSTGNDDAFCRIGVNGTVTVIAREGDPIPGLPGGDGQLSFFNLFEMDWVHFDDGNAACYFSEPQYPWDWHLWVSSEVENFHIAGTGQWVPGIPDATFVEFGFLTCLDGGHSAGFLASYRVGADTRVGLFRVSLSQGIEPIAYYGQTVAEIPDAHVIAVGFPDDSGMGGSRSGFRTRVSGPGISSSNDRLEYFLAGGQPILAAREGEASPIAGLINQSFTSVCPFHEGMYCLAMLSGPGVTTSNNALLYRTDGVLRQTLARTGDQAPDFPPGVELSSFALFQDGHRLIGNSMGQIAIRAMIRDQDNIANNEILYLSDVNGQLYKTIRSGDSVATPSGEPKLIRNFLWSGLSDGGHAWVQLLFSDLTHGVYRLRLGCQISGCELADLNRSCTIDIEDLALLLSNFGANSPAMTGDLDDDGDVDLQDLANLLTTFGTDCRS